MRVLFKWIAFGSMFAAHMGAAPNPSNARSESAELVKNGKFLEGLTGWEQKDRCDYEVVGDERVGKAVRISNRAQPWSSIQQDLTAGFKAAGPGLYELSLMASMEDPKEAVSIVLQFVESVNPKKVIYVVSKDAKMAPGGMIQISSRRPIAWQGEIQGACIYLKSKGTAPMKISGFSVRLIRGLEHLSFAPVDRAFRDEKALLGVIRWDGWTGSNATVGKREIQYLSPERFRHRIPWFAAMQDGKLVDLDGTGQETVDREILMARNAGIDYWMFCHYREIYQPWMSNRHDYKLGLARIRYLNSKYRRFVKWCDMFEFPYLNEPAELALQFKRMKEPDYVRVLGNRPLLYIFDGNNESPVRTVREKMREAGLPDPFVVSMAFANAPIAAMNLMENGADAAGRYGFAFREGLSFHDWTVKMRDAWSDFAKLGIPIVPWLSTSCDDRPRSPKAPDSDYNGPGTPGEIADMITKSFDWNLEHPGATPVNTVLVYAWNEYSEGGWLGPTLAEFEKGGRPERLDALRDSLAKKRIQWNDLPKEDSSLPLIQKMGVAKIFPDVPGDSFGPGAAVSRKQFAGYLSRAAALPEMTADDCKDLPEDIVFRREISTCIGLGLVRLENGLFFPERPITAVEGNALLEAVARFKNFKAQVLLKKGGGAMTRLEAAKLVGQFFEP